MRKAIFLLLLLPTKLKAVDYKQKVNIYLNGKRVFSKIISPDEQFTIANFKAHLDRKAIWENELVFSVK
ncbi:hypothetical protein [Mucilaginibacter flavidus]|uniref:hypothetical protein n=1 Tax=Mucilaginibacter flavidus TaxID=2949309 RepID=UPI002092BCFA|nr:hypothetical protein [Mucilaginibacter flavidus]MCO5947425.1 hypothetical protein [Mucilaginibacter flavidus]